MRFILAAWGECLGHREVGDILPDLNPPLAMVLLATGAAGGVAWIDVEKQFRLAIEFQAERPSYLLLDLMYLHEPVIVRYRDMELDDMTGVAVPSLYPPPVQAMDVDDIGCADAVHDLHDAPDGIGVGDVHQPANGIAETQISFDDDRSGHPDRNDRVEHGDTGDAYQDQPRQHPY